MKKIFLLVAMTVVIFAQEKTITATMGLMEDGLATVQKGFLYNNHSDLIRGVETMESANAIFAHVNVSTFIKNNTKVQVTKNINANLKNHLKFLKKDIKAKKYTSATVSYAKVMSDCISCHTIIRGW